MTTNAITNWVYEHKTEIACGTVLLGGLAAAAYFFKKPAQNLSLKKDIAPLEMPDDTSLNLCSGEGSIFCHENHTLEFELSPTRFENTPQLSGENCHEVWKPGDFTLRGTIHDGLVADRHTIVHWSREPCIEAALMERQSYHIHFDQGDFPALKEAIQKWRLDDVLIPLSLQKDRLHFAHKLTGHSFTGTLVKADAKPSSWLMTLNH